jgi:PTS system mannose-specific IIA component
MRSSNSMVGIIIITHGDLGQELINAGNKIYGETKQLIHVPIYPADGQDCAKQKLLDAIQAVDTGEGVLMLTDGFGGSPSNLCLKLMSGFKCEIVTGINLSMLMEALCYQERLPLTELAEKTEAGGKKGIVFISKMLRDKMKASQT